MLKRMTLLLLVSLLIAVGAAADEPREAKEAQPPAADYSRKTLLLVTRDVVQKPEPTVSFETVGEVKISLPYLLLRALYVPVPPLEGSVPRVTNVWPNPFVLTQMRTPMTPQLWARE
jgi:hypothetical protein